MGSGLPPTSSAAGTGSGLPATSFTAGMGSDLPPTSSAIGTGSGLPSTSSTAGMGSRRPSTSSAAGTSSDLKTRNQIKNLAATKKDNNSSAAGMASGRPSTSSAAGMGSGLPFTSLGAGIASRMPSTLSANTTDGSELSFLLLLLSTQSRGPILTSGMKSQIFHEMNKHQARAQAGAGPLPQTIAQESAGPSRQTSAQETVGPSHQTRYQAVAGPSRQNRASFYAEPSNSVVPPSSASPAPNQASAAAPGEEVQSKFGQTRKGGLLNAAWDLLRASACRWMPLAVCNVQADWKAIRNGLNGRLLLKPGRFRKLRPARITVGHLHAIGIVCNKRTSSGRKEREVFGEGLSARNAVCTLRGSTVVESHRVCHRGNINNSLLRSF